MSVPVLDRLREVAKSEKRSLSQQIELMVERHFAKPRSPRAKRKGVPA